MGRGGLLVRKKKYHYFLFFSRRVGNKRDTSEISNGEAIPALKLRLVAEILIGAPINW